VTVTFQVGAILHWEAFEFPDGGEPKNKYLVVVGSKDGHDCLLLIANTNRKHKQLKHGCNSNAGYYLIPGGGKDFFKEDTIVALRPLPTKRGELIKCGMEKRIVVKHNLPTNIANAIRNCLKQVLDVSEADLELL
jgi:hypothetical protein